MKIKKNIIYFLSFLFIFGTNNLNVVNAAGNDMASPEVKYDSEYNVSYYSDIQGLKGDNLLEGLALLSQNNHKTFTSYSNVRGGLAYSDVDPNDSTKVIDFYTGWSLDNTWCSNTSNTDYINPWNREHVWCQNRSGDLYGESYAGGDIHHIRAENYRINSARGDNPFAELTNVSEYEFEDKYNNKKMKTGCKLSDGYFEPRDAVKGDVARILMYMYMHYSNEVDINKTYVAANKDGATGLRITNIVYTPAGSASSAWKLLLKWNELDPVDSMEKNRNDYCTSVTGVRNPFIDHEEFANMIWDSSYSGEGALNDTDIPKTPDEEEPIDPVIPDTSTSITYTFSDYNVGTQYAENEEHILDSNTTITTTQCYFTSELRIYSSSTHNGNAIIKSNKKINKIDFNMGDNIDTLNLYNEANVLIGSITTTSSSYLDYSINIEPSSNYLKLDVKGSNQLRIKSITLYFDIDEIELIKNIDTKAQLDFSYNYEEGNNKDVTLSPSPSTSTYMNTTYDNYANLLGLDEDEFKVTGEKGKSNYYPYIHVDKEVRIYAERGTGEGNSFTLELKNQSTKINFITLNISYEENIIIKDSKGNIITGLNSTYTINDYKFTITNAQSSGEKNQTAILKSIDINYGQSAVYSNFNSVNIRYSALIPNEIFDNIDSYGINIKINNNSKDYEILKTTGQNSFKEFALVIKNIKDYTTEITATAYVYIDNERIELKSKTYSVATMIDYYINNSKTLNLTNSQIEALTSFKESF